VTSEKEEKPDKPANLSHWQI